ncbi:MBL fold metallo-hydrolase [Solimonas marina]|uniref:3',5'-cyclic-nucleotide phosphodiesterase n=1 Tax=Solimonas marina TaxID=2714601 RepID=A0A969W9L6_9GAMM|nr:3',5'-cyclic-nucleotide phosphodiesterase [Solimonas marina]NKF22528.1 3',5'-cyclic-nucleotide phosphodiesterase [Solimonas marina]
MRIKVLGCSGGVGPGLRTTSLLLDDEILIDAGTGVGDLTLAQQQRIRHVLLTHAHLDHVCGLAFMADNLFDLIEAPIGVHASRETLQTLRQHIFNWEIWPDFSRLPDEESPLLRWHELAMEEVIELGERRITPFRVLHTVPANGYVIDGRHGTFAFTGDTYADDVLWTFLNRLPRLDKLMIEIAFPDHEAALGHASKHFTPALLGGELRKLDHRPKLYLTHHKPGTEAQIERECRQALRGYDYVHLKRGDTISLS